MADMATLVYEIDSSAARSAATDLAKLNDASARAAGGADKLNKSLRDSQGRFRSSLSVAKEYGSEVRSLAAKYNPALSAVYQYQQAQLELNRAVALGVLTQGQADAALSGVAAGMQRAAASAAGYAGSMRGVNNIQGSVGNQFAQLNDVVVTAWGGMNPALIGMQQGMQMVQGFAGQSLPQALGTLRGAFAQLFNPVTFATIAIVAGAAALIQWGTSALSGGEDTDAFKESIDALNASVTAVNEISKIYSADGLQSLKEKYGEVNAEILAMVENQRQFAVNSAVEDARKAASLLLTEYDSLLNQVSLAEEASAELTEELGLTSQQAYNLRFALQQLRDADSFDDQAAALRRVNEVLAVSSISTSELSGLILDAESAMRQLAASAPEASWMNAAISGVGRLGAAIRARIGEASRLATIANAPGMTTGNADWAKSSLGFTLPGNELLPPVPAGSGSAGGGGASVADEMQKRWEALNQGFQAELTLKTEQYNKDLVALKWALDQKIISEQQYQMNKHMLQVEAFGLDYERNLAQYSLENAALQTAFDQKLLTEQQYLMRRRELQHQYYSESIGVDQSAASQQLSQMAADFGQMNSLAGGGYDSLLRAQKAFAAGSALINAYLAASQAMADPTVPYWMKIAAYAKVLAAGMGAVNAIKGGGGRGGSAASSSVAATKQEPTKNILVNLTGPAFMVDMAEEIMTQIYSASKDGRVIIARDVT